MCRLGSSSVMALDLMRARCPPLEGAMEEDDGEVELTLGLSVGGSSRKAPMADAAARGREAEAKSGEAELDLSGPVSSPPSSPRPLPLFLHDVDGDGGAALDQARRREIHALRRREARRKREEKKQQQQRRGIGRATSAAKATGFCGVDVTTLETACSPEDRLAMEAQEQKVRAKDREARVEAMDSVPNHMLSANGSSPTIPKADAFPDPILNPSLVPFPAQSFPVVAMPYPYPHLQYFPATNGFGIPCMMPCWAPAMSPGAEGTPRAECNVVHPVACRAFQPFPSPPDEVLTNRGSPVSSNAVESNAGKHAAVDAAERTPSWTASQGSSSSPAASGHQSGSPRGSTRSGGGGGGGGGSSSSEERSHSRQSPSKRRRHPEPPLPQLTSLPQGQSDSSISSRPTEPDPSPESSRTPCPDGIASPAKPVVPAGGSSGPPLRQAGPRPQLPRMPCVSTTGNGPNGRTVTGVLYRYTKTEVSIVCACHGTSFSPAEFVQHAGGTDVTHPLRQITVVSS